MPFLLRKFVSLTKWLAVLSLFGFVWIFFTVTNHDSSGKSNDASATNRFETVHSKSAVAISNSNYIATSIIHQSLHSPSQIESYVSDLEKIINKNNHFVKVLNVERFGHLKPNDIVIVIQVHDRYNYLNELIKSLEHTKEISNVLLVFSHDVYLEHINELINNITFCKVVQIFYPFSLQLHPNTFPGQSPNDCPRDISKEEANKLKCNNYKWPDAYGHYREARYTQTKHHWTWKVNFVMEKLSLTKNHSGYFMFLEEDHYLAPDAIHVLRHLIKFRLKNCPKCDIITLGVYAKSINFAKKGNVFEISRWISSRHNMGFVFDRRVWNSIKSCANQFCTYDDYNWDWSLQYISEKCLTSPLTTLVVATPRVFHIGECGVHHKGKDCNNFALVNRVEQVLKESKKYLFPQALEFQKGAKKLFKLPKVNGGWADQRDHQLCLKQFLL